MIKNLTICKQCYKNLSEEYDVCQNCGYQNHTLFPRWINAIFGNLIYRLTGNNKWIDSEWNDEQSKMPSKKSWFNLLVVFPLALVLLYFILWLFV